MWTLLNFLSGSEKSGRSQEFCQSEFVQALGSFPAPVKVVCNWCGRCLIFNPFRKSLQEAWNFVTQSLSKPWVLFLRLLKLSGTGNAACALLMMHLCHVAGGDPRPAVEGSVQASRAEGEARHRGLRQGL